jgi:ligand-binding sensor domain-containing protein
MVTNLPAFVSLKYYRAHKLFWRLLVGFVLLFISQNSFSQNIIPRFETIGVNDGLSQSSAYTIYQDKKGFMWFGTADGLNRFDGHSIKVFKVKDNAVANSNYVRGTLCEDKAGNIWYTNETGVFCLDVAKETLTRRHMLTQDYQASGVFIDAQDNFWMLCTNGVASFDIKTGKWQRYTYKFILNDKNATGFRYATDHERQHLV